MELYSKVDWLEQVLEMRDQQMHTALNKENELETLRRIIFIDEMYLKAELNSSKREIQKLRHTHDGKGSDISRLESDAKKMKVELDRKDKELDSRQELRHILDEKGVISRDIHLMGKGVIFQGWKVMSRR